MTYYFKKSVYSITLLICVLHSAHSKPYQQSKKEHVGQVERCDRAKPHVTSLKKWYRGAKPTPKDLHSYNLLRQLWKVTPVKTVLDMSKEWLRDMEEERMREYCNHKNPSQNQKAWLSRAQEALEVTDVKVSLGSTGQPFAANVSATALGDAYIALDESENKKFTIFTAYHECGHIANGDEPYQVGAYKPPEVFVELFENKAITEKVALYLDKAQKHLDQKTTVGKTLHETLLRHKKLWQEPASKQEYARVLKGRIQEQKADLAAFSKLFEEKQFDVMFYIIHLWATQKGERAFVATGTEYVHPSYAERALYLIGYLIDQGIDVNGALQAYEKVRGTKSAFKDMNVLIESYENLYKTKKVTDVDEFLKVYEDLKKEPGTIDESRLTKAFDKHKNIFKTLIF